MWMNVGHVSRLGAFQQNNGPMGTASEGRRLRKQPSISQRRCEIGVRLPFDDNTVIDVIVTNGETLHLDVEIAAFTRESNQRGVTFREVDAKPVSCSFRRIGGTLSDETALGVPVSSKGMGHHQRRHTVSAAF